MEAQELRLGNWVFGYDPQEHNHPQTGYFKVHSIEEGRINAWRVDGFETESATCNPIPLTPEILEKAGFEKWENSDAFSVEFKDGNTFQFRLPDEYFLGGQDSVTGGHGFTGKIQHVHQLMNLYFALTGEELNIEL